MAHRKWEDRGQRNKLLRMLNERQRANLDILESNEAPRPASPTRQDVSEADVTPAKVAPVSRISAAVRAEDRRKAEKVRASAVFSALGDGAWASQTQEVEMAVEEEVVVKAEEAPIKLNGSVRFEIKKARAAPTRPALDAFSQIEDIVEQAPVRAPVARPKPAAPVEVVEPPVIDCAGGVSASRTMSDESRRWRMSPPGLYGPRPSPRVEGTHARHSIPGLHATGVWLHAIDAWGLRPAPILDAIDAIPATQAATAAGWPSRTRLKRASSWRRPRGSCAAPSSSEAVPQKCEGAS